MKILVLNCGSSSVKYKLIDTAGDVTRAEGGVEKIGLDDGFLKFKRNDGSKEILNLGNTDHKGAVSAILNLLTDAKEGCIASFAEIDAVGHRVVHGGEKFNKSVLITSEVIDKVKECYDIAPLHNPANITGIEAISALMPDVPQVAVFDTAFHQTMPAKSYLYALPYKYYKEDGVRRYGFHGTSHRYVSARVCEFLGVDIEKQRIITCHVGNGGSITAVKYGKSIDTSMGLTPTEGLMMGTRVGDIDPGAITFLMGKHNLSAADIQRIINKESGVAGVSEISSDMREIEAAVNADGERFRLVRLPLPRAIFDEDGLRLPATYANFLIGNGFVLMPTYGQSDLDNEAATTLAKVFPDRAIACVDCRALIRQHGSLHCVTMQFPFNTLNNSL